MNKIAAHNAGCPYKEIAVRGTKEENAKYYSGYCPSCNSLVKWEEETQQPPNRSGTSS